VSDEVARSGIVGPSIGWGSVFGAGIAFGILYYILAAVAGVRNGDFGFWMSLVAIPVGIVGGAAGAVLFGVVGVIARFGPRLLAPSPLSYAVSSCLVWGAGGWLLALNAPQGGFQAGDLPLLYSLLPVAIAGLLTGGMVRSGRRHAYRTSRPGAN
jgi:hypothetical protein